MKEVMVPKKDGFFINNPVFLKVRRRFSWKTLRREEWVKWVFVNERIVEIPFVVSALGAMDPRSRVLDLGCAESLMPMYLAGMGLRVTGVDFRAYPYTLPDFTFLRADILKLPVDKGFFDACTAVSTLEHIGIGHYDDPLYDDTADIKAAAEVARVLRPGGIFLLSVPFGKPFQGSLQRVYDSVRLDRLLQGFQVEKKVFYASAQDAGAVNNFWHPLSEQKAAEIASEDRTRCVCLVKAVKP